MQIRSDRLSQLQQRLIQLYQAPLADLDALLSKEVMTRGTVYTLRRKCSKASCRCARGEYHSSEVLTANIGGKTRLWTISEGRLEELHERTQRYRRFRQARKQLIRQSIKRQRELLDLIEAIEKIRTQAP